VTERDVPDGWVLAVAAGWLAFLAPVLGGLVLAVVRRRGDTGRAE